MGMALFAWSLRYRKCTTRIRELLNPKPWFTNMRKLRPLMRSPGYAIIVTGAELFMSCLVIRIIFLGWDNWWWMPW
jgi:hypothetical protein